jgi:hypothetical protein
MTSTIFGHHKKSYIIQVSRWAKRLEADDMTIHEDKTVTLECADGCICNHYKPTPQELKEV